MPLTFGVAGDKCAWPLYAFLVRHLRLADQAATAALNLCMTQIAFIGQYHPLLIYMRK